MEVLRLVHGDLDHLRRAVRSCFLNLSAGGGVVRNPRGAFLAIYRNGKWDLPKGKLEAGESFDVAALREVEEETGLLGVRLVHLLTSTFHTYCMKGQEVLKETRWFVMEYTGDAPPELQGEEGITDYRWVLPGEEESILSATYASISDVLECFLEGTS
jgi:8-oxo-dGTP pyrophosphatase MutT (NUDIX family)